MSQTIRKIKLESPVQAIDEVISGDARALSANLQMLREKLFPPEAKKQLRKFSSGEAAKLIGVTDSYLRLLSTPGEGPAPEMTAGGRRAYTLEHIHELRKHLAKGKPSYLPKRLPGEHLQTIAVTNFKGGSGKTTSAAHLAQFFALRGYRVLAIDLDLQASMSALFGYQPNLTSARMKRFTARSATIRTGDHCPKSFGHVFPGLDLVPANLELHEFEHDTPKVLSDDKRDSSEMFFARVAKAVADVDPLYDVIVINCPPQLGFLTLSALCAATSVLITAHPQMLDIASMNQFLAMAADLLAVVRKAGGNLQYDWIRYLITRYEPNDAPQTQI